VFDRTNSTKQETIRTTAGVIAQTYFEEYHALGGFLTVNVSIVGVSNIQVLIDNRPSAITEEQALQMR